MSLPLTTRRSFTNPFIVLPPSLSPALPGFRLLTIHPFAHVVVGFVFPLRPQHATHPSLLVALVAMGNMRKTEKTGKTGKVYVSMVRVWMSFIVWLDIAGVVRVVCMSMNGDDWDQCTRITDLYGSYLRMRRAVPPLQHRCLLKPLLIAPIASTYSRPGLD